MTNTAKAIAVILASLLVVGLALAHVLRGTEGIGIVLVLTVGMGILFAWRTH